MIFSIMSSNVMVLGLEYEFHLLHMKWVSSPFLRKKISIASVIPYLTSACATLSI